MMHFLRVSAFLGLLGLAASPAVGQDAAGVTDELRELRKTVDQQSKQIEMLTREVARLGAALESKPARTDASTPAAKEPKETTASATPTPPAASGENPPATPTPPAPGAASSEEFSANPPPKADPAHPRHIVIKGDTLTSVAKQYNITIADLQKANKDVNERKLQIGQSLNLPPNAQIKAPAPAATPEPKQNP